MRRRVCVRARRTGDGVGEVLVVGLPQQTHQGGNAIAVLDGDLVLGVPTVGDVLQRSARCVVHLE